MFNREQERGRTYACHYRPHALFSRFHPVHWDFTDNSVYSCILLRENYPKARTCEEGLKDLHFILGLSVLALCDSSDPCPAVLCQHDQTGTACRGKCCPTTHLRLCVHAGDADCRLCCPHAADKTIPFFGLELPALCGRTSLSSQYS